MPNYAVVKADTGEAVSFGTVVADPLPPGLQVITVDHFPGEDEQWDPTTKQVKQRNVADLIRELGLQRDAIEQQMRELGAPDVPRPSPRGS